MYETQLTGEATGVGGGLWQEAALESRPSHITG